MRMREGKKCRRNKNLAAGPLRTEPLASLAIYGVAQKECNDFDP